MFHFNKITLLQCCVSVYLSINNLTHNVSIRRARATRTLGDRMTILSDTGGAPVISTATIASGSGPITSPDGEIETVALCNEAPLCTLLLGCYHIGR